MSRRSHSLLLVVGFLVTAGCGDLPMDGQPVQGYIDGEPWEYTSGKAEIEDDDTLRIDLYAGTDDPCGFGLVPEGADHRRVSGSFIPAEPGEYSEQWVSTSSDEGSTNTDRNDVVIDEIGDEKVTGALRYDFDDDNQVSGEFELIRCANVD